MASDKMTIYNYTTSFRVLTTTEAETKKLDQKTLQAKYEGGRDFLRPKKGKTEPVSDAKIETQVVGDAHIYGASTTGDRFADYQKDVGYPTETVVRNGASSITVRGTQISGGQQTFNMSLLSQALGTGQVTEILGYALAQSVGEDTLVKDIIFRVKTSDRKEVYLIADGERSSRPQVRVVNVEKR